MSIAAKHGDPVVGIDVHIVQPPGPVPPLPIPHPFVGMVFDAIDLIPKIGSTVFINGMPAGVAGTGIKAMPPHIPMGGVFVKPPGMEGEIFMGSATVLADGEPLSSTGMMALTCTDIGMPPLPRMKKQSPRMSLFMPTSTVLSIPMGAPVLVGGPPTPVMMGAVMGAAGNLAGAFKKLKKVKKLDAAAKKAGKAWKKTSDGIHKAAEKAMKKAGVESNRARRKVHDAICSVTGHPVDIATGRVFTTSVDFEIPGPIPLVWERRWDSTTGTMGPLGHGWTHAFNVMLLAVDNIVAFHTDDGRVVGFPKLGPGQEAYDRKDKLICRRDDRGRYSVTTDAGLTYHFSDLRGKHELQFLVQVENRAGHVIHFTYDRHHRLSHLTDSGGRRFEFEWSAQGRITAITGPDPNDSARRVDLVVYGYSYDGSLVEVKDALGHREKYKYRKDRLLVQETTKNGLNFYFEWSGMGTGAKCVRTWGDSGIYDHKLTYDATLCVTTVENSLGHKTKHFHSGGVVYKTEDPLGNTTETKYGRHNEVLCDTDELGRVTLYEYDERKDVTKIVSSDGATLTLEYAPGGLPSKAVDALGGQWAWSYDERGRLAERTDPLGHVTRYDYADKWLVAITDPAGGRTTIAYDAEGNLNTIFTPDRQMTLFHHDGLGRVTTVIDPKGNEQRRFLDLLGRITRLEEPDGNVRELSYDREGNCVHAKDRQHDVRFTYRGMGRLAMREEAGTKVRFGYDTEEQLTHIRNEHGLVYGFKLGPTGEVEEESGFDGLVRRYTRNAAGEVMRVDRAANRFSEYVYDAAGRVVAITHSDGTFEIYHHRLDGELVMAKNQHQTVTFERDLLGRVSKETQGDDWVESEYGALGLRMRMRSSLAAEQVIERNAMGDVEKVASGGGFDIGFRRDELGLELERSLPGGLRSKWERDKLGRPVRHQVESCGKVLRAVGYSWEPNDRLKMVIDAIKGPTKYGHDELGNLSWAQYADGAVDLRMPDAVGNLFRTEERTDRKYGPAGELREAHGPRGVTRYFYDPEGNLVEKHCPGEEVWQYEWNGSGMLAVVRRPDGTCVEFEYDALGRRVAKTYRGQTTRWVWDGNNPLHEWVEGELEAPPAVEFIAPWMDDAIIKRREAELSEHLAQGPPERGTREAPITWLFEPESFSPMAKLSAAGKFSIVTDHLGTPVGMYSETGEVVWSAGISAYGELRDFEGNSRHACPFRWPGQHEDAETGLYYNRFRYYDAEAGQYASQDPLRLEGGKRPHGYVHDPLTWTDCLGLTALNEGGHSVYGLFEPGAKEPYYVGVTNDPTRRRAEHLDSGRLSSSGEMRGLHDDLTYAEARGREQHLMEKHNTRTGKRGEPVSATNRGNKINSFDKSRTDVRGRAFKTEYDKAKKPKCG